MTALVVTLITACTGSAPSDGSDASADGPATSAPTERPLVAASTPLVAALVRSVAGEEVRVRQLSDPGDDPARIAEDAAAGALEGADLVVLIDEQTFERSLDEVVRGARSASVPVLALAPQLNPIPLGGSELDPSSSGSGTTDPRVWLDPDRWTQAARLVADALEPLGGVDGDVLAANVAAFDAALGLADERLQAAFARVPDEQRTLVSTLPSLAYLTDRYGFDLHVAETPAALATTATENGATSVLTSPTRVGPLTTDLAAITPLLVVAVDIDGDAIPGLEGDAAGATTTYVRVLESAAEAITTAATTT